MNVLSIATVLLIILGLAYAARKKMLVSQTVVVINFIVFFILIFTSRSFYAGPSPVFHDLAFRPSYLEAGGLSHTYTLFTSMFIHSDIFHILMNMIIFLLIGIPFEQRVGSRRFATIYFTSGVAGAIFFSIFNWGSDVMLVGASGAIFGVFGAFAALYPRDRVVMPIPFPIMFFVRMPVIVATIMFAALESLYTLSGVSDGVAHLAHIGGLVSGIVLSVFVREEKHKSTGRLNFDLLEGLVSTDKQREALVRAKEADLPEVREAWLSYLTKEMRCPKCGGKLERNKGIHCKDCGYRIM